MKTAARMAKKKAPAHKKREWPGGRMTDEERKPQAPHEDMGDVGDLGNAGKLGTNAADRKEVDDLVDDLVPVEPGTKKIAEALEAVGYSPEEALQMAEAAVEKIETRERR